MQQTTKRLQDRFSRLRELLPTDILSVDDVMSWNIFSSQARLLGKNRLAKQMKSVHPKLRTKEFYELSAYARLVGKAVNCYVMGYGPQSGLIGLRCSHTTGRLGFLLGI
jgi:hypothetical protein